METKEDKLKLLEQLREEEKKLDDVLSSLKDAAAKRESIMAALHEYNDIKDTTQIVLGRLADFQRTTVTKLHEQFNLSEIQE